MNDTATPGKVSRISVDLDGIEDKLEKYRSAHGRPSKASVARAAIEWALNDADFMARVKQRESTEDSQAAAAGA